MINQTSTKSGPRHGKARSRFNVYVRTPSGRKTKGTYYTNDGLMLRARISFLQAILTPQHSIVLHDIRSNKAKDVFCGHRVMDRGNSLFYASLA